ncbi:Uncharacterised protein g8061 [Pycnogonum litorale]
MNTSTNGKPIYQGDMKLTDGQLYENFIGLTGRKGTVEKKLWQNGYIYYKMDSSLTSSKRNLIRNALNYYMKHSCVIFEDVGNGEAIQKDHVLFTSFASECSSDVGRQRKGVHEVSIGNGCDDLTVVLHEIGHTLGMFHEQARSDRDQYIKVLYKNIIKGYKYAFNKQQDDDYGIPYDYTSIMHYRTDGFSKRPRYLMTIATKDPTNEYLIASRKEPSFRDIKLINLMYKCNAHCKKRILCKNEGYLDTKCRCKCRQGTSGKRCERQYADYYPPNSCGGIVKREMKISSPKIQGKESKNCIWWIKAPKGYRVKLTISKVDLIDRYNDVNHPMHGSCVFEGVGIRKKSLYEGDIYCGKELSENQKIYSCKTEMVVNYFVNDYQYDGIVAKVKFVKGNWPC